MFMAIALPAPDLARTFSLIMDGLCRTTAARISLDRFAGPMLLLIFARLRRLAARFASLAAQIQAGPLPPPRPSRPAGGICRGTQRKARLPQSFAWLIRLVPGTAAYAGQVQTLLADPQTAALLEAAPRAGRILRPVCRMLAIPFPDHLRLPRPQTPAGADSADTTSESPRSDTPPAPAARAASPTGPAGATAMGQPPLPPEIPAPEIPPPEMPEPGPPVPRRVRVGPRHRIARIAHRALPAGP